VTCSLKGDGTAYDSANFYVGPDKQSFVAPLHASSFGAGTMTLVAAINGSFGAGDLLIAVQCTADNAVEDYPVQVNGIRAYLVPITSVDYLERNL
jgi:hypothetical protein